MALLARSSTPLKAQGITQKRCLSTWARIFKAFGQEPKKVLKKGDVKIVNRYELAYPNTLRGRHGGIAAGGELDEYMPNGIFTDQPRPKDGFFPYVGMAKKRMNFKWVDFTRHQNQMMPEPPVNEIALPPAQHGGYRRFKQYFYWHHVGIWLFLIAITYVTRWLSPVQVVKEPMRNDVHFKLHGNFHSVPYGFGYSDEPRVSNPIYVDKYVEETRSEVLGSS